MADPLYSPKLRLRRAVSHITRLEKVATDYVNSARLVIETDANGRATHKIKFDPIPDEMRLLAVEAIESLRSTLDQLGYATAILGGAPEGTRKAAFPFSASKEDLEGVIKGQCGSVPVNIVEVFRQFSPYKGGNEALWELNPLANGAKHAAIVPIAGIQGPAQIAGLVIKAPAHGGAALVCGWDMDKGELIVGFADRGGVLQYQNVEHRSYFVFTAPEVVKGKNVLDTLRNISQICEQVIQAVETECHASGLIQSSQQETQESP